MTKGMKLGGVVRVFPTHTTYFRLQRHSCLSTREWRRPGCHWQRRSEEKKEIYSDL